MPCSGLPLDHLKRWCCAEAACSAASTSCPCCQKPTRPSKGAGRPQRARRRLSLPGVCKAVLLLAGLLLGLHALSCGLLFCVRLPWTMSVPSEAYQELHGLYGLSGALLLLVLPGPSTDQPSFAQGLHPGTTQLLASVHRTPGCQCLPEALNSCPTS